MRRSVPHFVKEVLSQRHWHESCLPDNRCSQGFPRYPYPEGVPTVGLDVSGHPRGRRTPTPTLREIHR